MALQLSGSGVLNSEASTQNSPFVGGASGSSGFSMVGSTGSWLDAGTSFCGSEAGLLSGGGVDSGLVMQVGEFGIWVGMDRTGSVGELLPCLPLEL